MSNKPMSLEQVRDRLRNWYGGSQACLDVEVCEETMQMIVAINAHLTSREAKGDAQAPVALALGVDDYAQLVCKPLEAWSSLPEDWDGSLYAHPATQQAAEPVEQPKPEQAVGDGVVGEIVDVYVGESGAWCHRTSWVAGRPPAPGTKLYTTPPAVATPAEVTESRYIATGHGASDEVHRAANLLEKIPARHANDRAIMQAAVSYLRAHASSLASHPHTATPSGGVKVPDMWSVIWYSDSYEPTKTTYGPFPSEERAGKWAHRQRLTGSYSVHQLLAASPEHGHE